jgi:P pilus assembly chaperone PapD
MAIRRTLGPGGLGVMIFALTAMVQVRAAVAQVPAEVEIRGGRGSTLVRNASRTDVDVEIALWESDETGERVELLEPADVNVWPTEFRLRPGETQTVRLLAAAEAYPANTLLRFEARFIPVETTPIPTAAESTAAAGAEARLRLVTRILSKVWIR